MSLEPHQNQVVVFISGKSSATTVPCQANIHLLFLVSSFRSLHYDLKEEDIIKVFSAFGPVTRCDMSFEPTTGKSKGFCFLEFAEPMYAEAAMIMNGFEIGGRKVS